MSEGIDIYLVRHGEAIVPWSQAGNSGLSDTGQRQAQSVAEQLAYLVEPTVLSSPLIRAVETASPLSKLSRRPIAIDERFTEVPLAPDLAIRRAWLAEVADLRWSKVSDEIGRWREAAWIALLATPRESVIFTHFMLINALVSRAMADDRLVCFEPDYGSVTRLRISPHKRCHVLELGRSLARNS
ncbi:MAG: histidine phosphatase family protein [Proteobacteria bacterium]|nr:histidine phosphatase family protein [Pseudomonadota bacterium]